MPEHGRLFDFIPRQEGHVKVVIENWPKYQHFPSLSYALNFSFREFILCSVHSFYPRLENVCGLIKMLLFRENFGGKINKDKTCLNS